MDPDETLRRLLAVASLVVATRDREPGTDPARLPELADELAEGILALDGWLHHGGFLPEAWFLGEHRGRRPA